VIRVLAGGVSQKLHAEEMPSFDREVALA